MDRIKIIRQIIMGIFFIIFFSCDSPNEKVEQPIQVEEDNILFFEKFKLGNRNEKLFLNAWFSECGEWGGHKEKMTIYAKEDGEFYLDYQKYKFNCDSIPYYESPEYQKLELEKTLELNNENKKSICNYIQRMIKSKVEERAFHYAGNIFSVVESDSTLFIKVYSGKSNDLMSYNKLLNELSLDTVKYD